MSVQLNELLEKIKNEGVKQAENLAEDIRKNAEARAEQIISDARKKAREITESAEKAAAQFEFSAREAIGQAGRDLLLKLKSKIAGLFDSIILRETQKALDSTVVKESILAIIRAWAENKKAELKVLIPPKMADALKKNLLKELSAEFRKGIEIRPSSELEAGFKIGEKDGTAFYDFTDRGLAEILSEFLNPRLAECLKEKTGKTNEEKRH